MAHEDLRNVAGEREGPVPRQAVLDFAHQAAAPLMTLTMISELLIEDAGLSPSQTEDIRKIHQAGRELSRMIRDFKSRI